MTQHASFRLDDHLNKFIEDQIAKGRYSDASQVVTAALELLEEHEAKLAKLRDALIEGEASGPATPFDFDDFIGSKRVSR